jgi:transcription elongation factor GreB
MPRSTAIISMKGEQMLREELHQLWKVERPVVCQAVSDAAKQGDRSENGDYIYGKRRLAEIDRRVRYLNKRLDEMKVVTQPPSDPNKVYFGALVELEDEDGQTLCYQIVGPDEFDPKENKISIDSPMAKALLGKAVDTDFELHVNGKTSEYYIAAISYPDFE